MAARLRLDELKAAEGVRLWRSAMAAALLKEAVRLRRGEMAAVVRLQEREAVRLRRGAKVGVVHLLEKVEEHLVLAVPILSAAAIHQREQQGEARFQRDAMVADHRQESAAWSHWAEAATVWLCRVVACPSPSAVRLARVAQRQRNSWDAVRAAGQSRVESAAARPLPRPNDLRE